MFNILLSSHTQKFLRKSERLIYDRLMEKIKGLTENPFPSDSKRVVGKKEKLYRVRVGHYRILYLVSYELNEIFILDIDKRSIIYNK